MKLKIRRDQEAKTGIFGGHKGMLFKLSCQVELTPEEKELIEKYKAKDYVLGTVKYMLGSKEFESILTVDKLVRGCDFTHDNVFTLLKSEEEIIDACKAFKTLLEIMKSFGGEREVEF